MSRHFLKKDLKKLNESSDDGFFAETVNPFAVAFFALLAAHRIVNGIFYFREGRRRCKSFPFDAHDGKASGVEQGTGKLSDGKAECDVGERDGEIGSGDRRPSAAVLRVGIG